MEGIKKMRSSMDTVLERLQIFLFAVMVIVGTYQILVRYLFNKPSTVSEELLTYAFAWLALLAAAYMFGKRGHMRMGFLADKANGTIKSVLDMISECLVFLFAAIVMIYGGIEITSLTMAQKTASLGIPMGYVYSIVPVSGGLILVYSILNGAEMMIAKSSDSRENEAMKGEASKQIQIERKLEKNSESIEKNAGQIQNVNEQEKMGRTANRDSEPADKEIEKIGLEKREHAKYTEAGRDTSWEARMKAEQEKKAEKEGD